MLTVCVLRHAKSGWETGADDHDRPLASRGRRAAPLVGAWLREHERCPALVLCSSARRARDTLAGLGDLGDPAVEVSGDYYLAAAGDWVRRLRAVPDRLSPVLVVGHNPGLHQLVVDLLGGAGHVDAPRTLPTAALAVLDVDGRWADLGRDAARLAAFVRPRDLQ
jgi:phosphohistidine phosphatase